MSGDPLRLVWQALEARGCRPHGKAFDFRASCPGHAGDNRSSLHVGVGADGRAVLWCFARQCPAEEVVAALDLEIVDLFPDGHRRARRCPMKQIRKADFTGSALKVVNVLHALERLEEPWQLMLTSACPRCGSPGAWLRANSDGRADADCPEGCDAHDYVQALLGRLDDHHTKRAETTT